MNDRQMGTLAALPTPTVTYISLRNIPAGQQALCVSPDMSQGLTALESLGTPRPTTAVNR